MWWLLLVLTSCAPTPAPKSGDSDESDADTDTDTDADTDTDTDADSDVDTGSPPTPFIGWTLSMGPLGGDNGFDCEDDSCSPTCTDNKPPVLDPPVYVVNGVEKTSPNFSGGDVVFVRIGFSDPDCNLDCGAVGYSYEAPGDAIADFVDTCSNLPCDSSGGHYFGFGLGKIQAGFKYEFSVSLDDGCGARSNKIAETFTP